MRPMLFLAAVMMPFLAQCAETVGNPDDRGLPDVLAPDRRVDSRSDTAKCWPEAPPSSDLSPEGTVVFRGHISYPTIQCPSGGYRSDVAIDELIVDCQRLAAARRLAVGQVVIAYHELPKAAQPGATVWVGCTVGWSCRDAFNLPDSGPPPCLDLGCATRCYVASLSLNAI